MGHVTEMRLSEVEMGRLLYLVQLSATDKHRRLFVWSNLIVERRNKLDACFILRNGAGELRLTHSEMLKLMELMGGMLSNSQHTSSAYRTWDGVLLSVTKTELPGGVQYTVRKPISSSGS